MGGDSTQGQGSASYFFKVIVLCVRRGGQPAQGRQGRGVVLRGSGAMSRGRVWIEFFDPPSQSVFFWNSRTGEMRTTRPDATGGHKKAQMERDLEGPDAHAELALQVAAILHQTGHKDATAAAAALEDSISAGMSSATAEKPRKHRARARVTSVNSFTEVLTVMRVVAQQHSALQSRMIEPDCMGLLLELLSSQRYHVLWPQVRQSRVGSVLRPRPSARCRPTKRFAISHKGIMRASCSRSIQSWRGMRRGRSRLAATAFLQRRSQPHGF